MSKLTHRASSDPILPDRPVQDFPVGRGRFITDSVILTHFAIKLWKLFHQELRSGQGMLRSGSRIRPRHTGDRILFNC
jgi:hypothetical protein